MRRGLGRARGPQDQPIFLPFPPVPPFATHREFPLSMVKALPTQSQSPGSLPWPLNPQPSYEWPLQPKYPFLYYITQVTCPLSFTNLPFHPACSLGPGQERAPQTLCPTARAPSLRKNPDPMVVRLFVLLQPQPTPSFKKKKTGISPIKGGGRSFRASSSFFFPPLGNMEETECRRAGGREIN